MNDLLSSIIEREAPAYVELWKEISEIETPSNDKAALDRLMDRLQQCALQEGYLVHREPFEAAGDCLRIDLPGNDSAPVLLMAHMDTVHEVGKFGLSPVKIEGDIISGPGVLDCKGGAAMALLILKALKESGVSHPPVRVMFTSDEEISARLSKAKGIQFIEDCARDAKYAINCESGNAGALTVARKGIMRIRLEITGISGHAGGSYFESASAVREAAHKILAIEALSQRGGCTFNCGVIQGGTVSNIVPDHCSILVDVRVMTVADIAKAQEQVRAICDHVYVDGTSCTMTIDSTRPPMEATEGNVRLFERMNQISKDHGLPTYESRHIGGGSDAAYTSRIGIPTVCSCGPTGTGCHTIREQASVSSLTVQSKLVAWTIVEV